ncbi:MAG: DUF992 domain-containing protein [Pseudomonadota bacterium]
MNQNFYRNTMAAIIIAAAALTPLSSASAFDARIEAGLLTCDVEAGTGLILGSSKDMDCEFIAVDEHRETYLGNVKKFGLDIGSTDRTTISWIVFAPTTELEAGALEGNYAGLSAEASVGVGIGANALIGGLDKSIALQPFSGQVQEGFNIAAGIGTMTLRNP